MSKAPRCDKCGKRLRASAHDALLSDLETGQTVGRYCVPGCVDRALKYMATGGGALRLTMRYPPGCLPEHGYCADGYGADPALLLFRPKAS